LQRIGRGGVAEREREKVLVGYPMMERKGGRAVRKMEKNPHE